MIAVVPTVDAAVKAESLGADALVAEGSESGGVQGFNGVSTMALVPAVADRAKVPVIAAGGIADSRGYRAALALGEEGVQIGTRFIATEECVAHEIYKKTIVDAEETGTYLVNLGRLQIRALRTPMVDQVLAGQSVGMETFSGEAMEGAWVNGDIKAGFLLAGQICGLVHSITSVREIIEEMVGSPPGPCHEPIARTFERSIRNILTTRENHDHTPTET